mgnify:CR=1 FL=1
MNSMEMRYLKLLRRLYIKASSIIVPSHKMINQAISWNVNYPDDYVEDYANVDANELSEILQKRITDSTPTLLTRFGSDIMMCTLASINRPNFINYIRYITNQRDSIGLQPWVVHTMTNNAGFFSESGKDIERDLYKFGDLINSIIPEIDILATVLRQERFYSQYF